MSLTTQTHIPESLEVNHTYIISDTLRGSGLAASISLSPGSAIVSTTAPYHIIVENSALDKVCSFCLIPSSSLKRCSACKIPRYCSSGCQKRGWVEGEHRVECRILNKLGAGMWEVRMLPTPVRGVMQLLLRAGMNVNGFYQGNGKDREWKKLESHEERFKGDKERWEDIVLQARGAMGFSGLGESEERLGDAVGLLCRMKTNSFRATSPDGTPIGLLLDPVFALANHSCTPNAELQCDGRHIQLRALREIKEGEQIFISYIDESEYLEARRQILEERYFFKCDCERCVEEAGRNGGDPP